MRAFLLLLLIAILACPTIAIRGERRALQQEADNNKTKKKSTTDSKSKNDKKKCKKPKKQKEKEKSKSKSKEESKSKSKEDPKRLRFLQEGNDDEVPYCLHAEFSKEECANESTLPRDGNLKSALSLQLVHSSDQDSEEIIDSVREILSNDTNPRFVGCRSMMEPKTKSQSKESGPKGKDEPKRRHHRHRNLLVRRALQPAEVEDDSIALEESDKNVDVTGVDFDNLSISGSGCDDNIILEDGVVCDVIESDVEIFWQASTLPDEDDEQEMRDLLVETILSQAQIGSFIPVGEVQAVSVDAEGSSSSNGDSGATTEERGQTLGDSPSSGDGDEKHTDYLPYVAAGVGGLLVFGAAYVYGTSGEEDDFDENEKNHDTSDDSDEDGNDGSGGGWFGGGGWVKKDEQDEAEMKLRKAQEHKLQQQQQSQSKKSSAKKESLPEATPVKPVNDGGWFGSSWGKDSEPEPEANCSNEGWFGF